MNWVDDYDLPYATVTGLFGETSEVVPDISALSGTVTFSPTVTFIKVDGAVIKINPVVVPIHSGTIGGTDGTEGVRILATDIPNDTVDNWGWRATFKVENLRIPPITFYAESGSVIDLSRRITGITGLPVEIVEGPQGIQGPQGPQGNIGPQGPKGDTGDIGPKGDPGEDGHSPEITFDGTTIVVDGTPGPDLKGDPGEGGGGIAGAIPIFETLAEAEAWEAANPGKTAYTIESADRDTEPPYWPQGVAVTATPGYDSVRFELSAMAQDDQGVTGYDVSLDSGATWVEATREAMDLIVPASPATTYPAVQIRARDGAGNVSSSLTGSGGFTTLSAPPITYREAVLADEPVYYLPLDDAVGSTTAANLGTAGGTLTPTAFTFGGAGIGDGSTAVELTTGSSLAVPGPSSKTTGFTVEGIVQISSVPTAVSRFLSYTTGSLLQLSTTPDIASYFGTFMPGKPLSVGKATHFAFVYDPSGEQRLYINGVMSTPVNHSTWSTGLSFSFGAFNGRAAGLAYFNKPLSDARVRAHAASSGAVA